MATTKKMIFRDINDIRNQCPSLSWTPRSDELRRRPRVGFLACSYLKIGGTETFHRTLLPELSKQMDIAGFACTGPAGGNPETLGVPYAWGQKAAQRLAQHCDVIVSWGIDGLASVLPGNRPKVIAVHHADVSSDWSNRCILDQLMCIDQIVCVDQFTAKQLKPCGKPVHFIPNAIDPRRLIPTTDSASLKATFDIPDKANVLLFGHRLSPEKRPGLAIEVLKHLPDDWYLVIVGDGRERSHVEQLAADCERIRIVGPCETLANWFQIADCFLSLSTFEGFGISVGEAVAAGVPTVSTRTGIAQWIANTLPIDATASEWAAAIMNAEAITNPQTVLDRYSVTSLVDSWCNVLNSVVKQNAD